MDAQALTLQVCVCVLYYFSHLHPSCIHSHSLDLMHYDWGGIDLEKQEKHSQRVSLRADVQSQNHETKNNKTTSWRRHVALHNKRWGGSLI